MFRNLHKKQKLFGATNIKGYVTIMQSMKQCTYCTLEGLFPDVEKTNNSIGRTCCKVYNSMVMAYIDGTLQLVIQLFPPNVCAS